MNLVTPAYCAHKTKSFGIGIVNMAMPLAETDEEGKPTVNMTFGVHWQDLDNAPFISFHDAAELEFIGLVGKDDDLVEDDEEEGNTQETDGDEAPQN